MKIPDRMVLTAIAIAASFSSIAPVHAWEIPPEQIAAIQVQMSDLRAQQAKYLAALDQANARMEMLEQLITDLTGKQPQAPEPIPIGRPADEAEKPVIRSSMERLDISGDVRLRYEENFGAEAGIPNRGRGVIRARLRAAYDINKHLTVGGQLVTGNPDDPNTADISLSNFADDLAVSLDQAYLQARFGNATIWGGKFSNPFTRSDLVWDGDVNPQGVAGRFTTNLFPAVSVGLTGLYFLIDEQVAGANSDMIGIQGELALQPLDELRLKFSGAYYRYSLGSVAGADAGDIRSNLINSDGRYLSDFNLVNAIAGFSYFGLGDSWPIKVSAEYVKNLGAATNADSAYSIAASLGRTTKANGWQLGYVYMAAETDAVFAAFSHDNLDLATNYRLHGISLDHVLDEKTLINATLYRYRKKDPAGPGMGMTTDWRQRLRLNLMVSF